MISSGISWLARWVDRRETAGTELAKRSVCLMRADKELYHACCHYLPLAWLLLHCTGMTVTVSLPQTFGWVFGVRSFACVAPWAGVQTIQKKVPRNPRRDQKRPRPGSLPDLCLGASLLRGKTKTCLWAVRGVSLGEYCPRWDHSVSLLLWTLGLEVEETNPESPVVATGTESSSVSGNLAVPTSVKVGVGEWFRVWLLETRVFCWQAETMLPALDVVMSLQVPNVLLWIVMSDIFSILEFEAALPHLSSAAAADVKARVGSVTITVVRGGVYMRQHYKPLAPLWR